MEDVVGIVEAEGAAVVVGVEVEEVEAAAAVESLSEGKILVERA